MKEEFDELAAALGDLSLQLGDQSVDKDQRVVRSSVDHFLSSSSGQHLSSLLSSPAASPGELSALFARLSPSPSGAAHGPVKDPSRVSTAVACQVLHNVSGELRHFAHLQTICEELYSFIYKDFKAREEGDGTARDLRGFMHGMPFFELAR